MSNVLEQVRTTVDELRESVATLATEIKALDGQIATAQKELKGLKDPSDQAGSVAAVVRETLAVDQRRGNLTELVESLSLDRATLAEQHEAKAAELAEWEHFLTQLEAFAVKAKAFNAAAAAVRESYADLLADSERVKQLGYRFFNSTIFEEKGPIRIPFLSVNFNCFEVTTFKDFLERHRRKWLKANNYASDQVLSHEELLGLYGDGNLM